MSQVAKTAPTTATTTISSNRPVSGEGRGVGSVATQSFLPVEEVSAGTGISAYGDAAVFSHGQGGPFVRPGAQPAPTPDEGTFRTTTQVFATMIETGQIPGERRGSGNDRVLPRAVLDRAIHAYQASARINGALARIRGGTLSTHY